MLDSSCTCQLYLYLPTVSVPANCICICQRYLYLPTVSVPANGICTCQLYLYLPPAHPRLPCRSFSEGRPPSTPAAIKISSPPSKQYFSTFPTVPFWRQLAGRNNAPCHVRTTPFKDTDFFPSYLPDPAPRPPRRPLDKLVRGPDRFAGTRGRHPAYRTGARPGSAVRLAAESARPGAAPAGPRLHEPGRGVSVSLNRILLLTKKTIAPCS